MKPCAASAIRQVIEMWRNRELQLYAGSLVLVGLLATIAAFLHSRTAGFIALALALSSIAISVLFTYRRYRDLARLAADVRRISAGDYKLDLRDNREGEISVLKNDIAKMSLKLSEQSEQLAIDKQRLTAAIADISHQLKTPLTSLMMMIEFLADPDLDLETRQAFAGRSSQQLERLEWLVSALLKLAKLDAGTVQFKQDKISIEALLKEALEPLLIPIDLKELKIIFEGDTNATCLADRHWTAEALTNILKNSIEHSPDSGNLYLLFSENPLYSEIIIQDEGSGIAKEDLPHLFKRFYKGKQAAPDSVGIGLNLAHSIITAQNGIIDISSQPGSKTTFSLKFYKKNI